uniref:Uncharacterized protein n=1 Tax=Hyaloperonospora arabidopsidis (strain Emoy2) TaxID=559515 RepID=M4B611_HYAAE
MRKCEEDYDRASGSRSVIKNHDCISQSGRVIEDHERVPQSGVGHMIWKDCKSIWHEDDAWRSILTYGIVLASRRQRTSTTSQEDHSWIVWTGVKEPNIPATVIGRSEHQWFRYKIARRLKWSEGSRIKYPLWTRRSQGRSGNCE